MYFVEMLHARGKDGTGWLKAFPAFPLHSATRRDLALTSYHVLAVSLIVRGCSRLRWTV